MTNPLMTSASDRDSAWTRAESYEKEERPMRPVRKIEVRGAVDVVFFRAPVACLGVGLAVPQNRMEQQANVFRVFGAGVGGDHLGNLSCDLTERLRPAGKAV